MISASLKAFELLADEQDTRKAQAHTNTEKKAIFFIVNPCFEIKTHYILFF